MYSLKRICADRYVYDGLHPENKQITICKTVLKVQYQLFIDDSPACCHEQANETDGAASSSTSLWSPGREGRWKLERRKGSTSPGEGFWYYSSPRIQIRMTTYYRRVPESVALRRVALEAEPVLSVQHQVVLVIVKLLFQARHILEID